MNTPRRSLIATIVGYLITAAAIVAVPVVLVPEASRSDFFWQRIAWTEFLALLVWGFFGCFATFAVGREKRGRGLGGILPVVGFIVSAYAIVSFGLMMMHAYGGGGETGDRVYSMLQTVAAALAAVTIVLMYFVRTGAIAGAEPIPAGIKTPSQLSSQISYHEGHVDALQAEAGQVERLKALLKALREKISHSLPGAGAIGRLEEYKRFSAEVADLCDNLDKIPADATAEKEVASSASRAEELARRVELVAQALKR